MKFNFDDKKFVLLAQRLIIRNVGFWPGDDKIRNWQIVFAIVSIIELLLFVVCEFWFSFAHIDDLAEFLRNFLVATTQFIIALKLLVIIWKRKDFKLIIDFIPKAFNDGEHCALFQFPFSTSFTSQKRIPSTEGSTLLHVAKASTVLSIWLLSIIQIVQFLCLCRCS